MLLIDLPRSRVHLLHLQLLPRRAKRAGPQNLVATFLYAIRHGYRHRHLHRNAKAVLEALFGIKSVCPHTPNLRLKGKKTLFVAKNTATKPAGCPTAEILLGIYFGFTVVYAISNQNFATIPFLLLFVWGYLYTGLHVPGQTYFAISASASTLLTSAPHPPAPPVSES